MEFLSFELISQILFLRSLKQPSNFGVCFSSIAQDVWELIYFDFSLYSQYHLAIQTIAHRKMAHDSTLREISPLFKLIFCKSL